MWILEKCQKKFYKLLLWTRRKQFWQLCHFFAKVRKNNDQMSNKLRSNGRDELVSSQRTFSSTAHPGIQDANSKTCQKLFPAHPNFFSNLNVLRTKIFFQDYILMQNAPLDTWNQLFWTYQIFFHYFEFFYQCPKKVWNQYVTFKSFMRSNWSSAFEECNLENTDDIFCQMPQKFWFKTRWAAPHLNKKLFSIGKFSSKCSFGHVKHVKCRFVKHADIISPKIPL